MYIYIYSCECFCRHRLDGFLLLCVDRLNPASTCLWTVPRAQALLRGRAWVAQLSATSVGWPN